MTTTTSENGRRILELLAQGKITVDEAEQLLRAVDGAASSAQPPPSAGEENERRWLRITIDKTRADGRPPKQVSIRVPMALVRGGIKLGAMFPKPHPVGKHQWYQGMDADFSKLDWSQIESVLNNLGETTIDVDKGKAQVRISYE